MAGFYRVRRGDCLSSIAFEHGLHPDTIWQRAENAELRALRINPNVLDEGDQVFVPDLREKLLPAATTRRHRYLRRGVPEVFRARFLDVEGEPRAGLRYTFSVDGGAAREGTTDGDGALREWIAPNARGAEVIVHLDGGEDEGDEGREEERHRFAIGELPPVTDVAGVRARLFNLGYDCTAQGDELGDDGERALRRFQEDAGLEAHGRIDDATRAALNDQHRV